MLYFSILQETDSVVCFPGRIVREGVCVPIIANPRGITYSLFILAHISVESTLNDTRKILEFVKHSTHQTLSELFEYPKGIILSNVYFLSQQPIVSMFRNGKFQFSSYGDLYFELLYSTRFNREKVEKMLFDMPAVFSFRKIIYNHSTHFSFNSIKFSNLSQAFLSKKYILDDEITSFSMFYKGGERFFASPSTAVNVSPLLFCKAKKIRNVNIVIDESNFRIIEKQSHETFYIGEFVLDLDGIVRVCINESRNDSALDFLDYTYMLEMLTTTLNIISIVSMSSLLVLYTVVPGLQTLPGLNIMSTTFSILCMQLTYTIANAVEKSTLFCAVVGLLQHYFWLSMCCCLFICTLHMCKSFTSIGGSMNRPADIRAVFIRYVYFCYITPVFVIVINIVISFSFQRNIGYGTNLCFVENFVQNLVTFIVPLLLTCVVNTVMFTLTVININFVKNINKSREDKNELLIFMKLFSLTGIIWIFQMIDAMLQLSVFSFVATILTSSQGFIIFLSFASSSRILSYFRALRNTDSLSTSLESKRREHKKTDRKQQRSVQ